MQPSKKENGGAVSGLILILLVLVVLALAAVYFRGTRGTLDASSVDVATGSEAVARDLGDAMQRIEEESRDAVTTAKVKTALALSKSVSSFGLDVDTEKGTVRLTGTVPNEKAESTALQIAGDVLGVVQVVDMIQVDPELQSMSTSESVAARLDDAELKAAVYESLLDDDRVEAGRIRVIVEDGVVTLVGLARTREQQDRALAAAGRVPGVRLVVNRLRIPVVSSGSALSRVPRQG
jgi:osmotically-inducible protein OsmY